jgi:HEAT repeat protein
MQDVDRQVRERAVAALGSRGDQRSAEALRAAMADQDLQVREQAAIALGRLSVDLLINSLEDQNGQAREAAAKSLGIIGDYRAAEALYKALQDRDEQVRKKAAEALERLNQNNNELLERLNQNTKDVKERLNQNTNRPLQDATAKPFGGQSDGVTSDHLRALSSSDPTERASAAFSLGRLGAVEAIPALVNLLGDDTPIRPVKCWDYGNWSPALNTFKQSSPGEQAAIALASFSQPAVDPLVAALGSANSSVRRNAAWAIGEIRGGLGANRSAAVDPLIAAMSDEDSWVRAAAAFSLGEMRPRQATETLVAALGDADWRVREMAARALGEMRSRSGVESLTGVLLRDENERVRRMAAWALGEIKDSRALDALNVALNDQDQQVRATARNAMLITDPIITEYVNRVGQNLVLHSDAKVPFTIKVIDSNEINPFALPGGFLYINREGLEAADNEADSEIRH